jgi:hypothetical protein
MMGMDVEDMIITEAVGIMREDKPWLFKVETQLANPFF